MTNVAERKWEVDKTVRSAEIKLLNCRDLLFEDLHDHPSYLCCPDALSPVGDPLSGNGCGSPNHILLSFRLCLIYSFYS